MEIGPANALPEDPVPSSSSSAADETSSMNSSVAASSFSSNNNVLGNISNGMRKFDMLDEDDEGDVCRICRNPGDTENPVRYPCACSGSIKFVHQDCLLQWLNHSNARQCEVCKHPFSFSLVYADNAPARLPFQEFIIGIAMKACHVLEFFLRQSFVLSVRLLIIPFITFWIWRLAFVRSLGDAQNLFLSHLSTTAVLTDCLHGFLLSTSFVFVFLGATSLRDFIRDLRELGGQDADREEEGERNGARAARRHAAVHALLEFHFVPMFVRVAEMPFDERDRMRGPVFLFVENAFRALAKNMIFLAVVIFVPFSLGHVILYYLSWLLSSTSSPVLSTVVPLTESALSMANMTLKNALTAVVNLTSDNHGINSLLGQVAENLKVNATAQTNVSSNITSAVAANISKLQHIGASRLSDATTLAVGYIFIFSLIIFYLGILNLVQYSRGEPLTMGIKVAFLLVIKVGVSPLMCGWWLDICNIRMFGKSISQRVEFFYVSPLASSLVHWVVGIFYMKQISNFLCLLRGVLRSGVLYFLRGPADPYYKPFLLWIDGPVHKHAQKVLLSVAVKGSLIVMLVFLPVKLAMRMVPSIFPLDISVSDPFTEIPVDMLLFQICTIEHFKLRHTLKCLLRYWFTAVGSTLGLTDFLLPKPEDENGNEDAGKQDRVGLERALAIDANSPRHVAASANFTDEPADPDRWAFVLRIVLLLVVAWMTLLVFNSALVVIPISLGRSLFNAVPLLPITHGIKCNDIYAFVIGNYVIWTALAGARYCAELIRTRRTRLLLNQIWRWCGIIFKSSVLLSIWILVIPVLIGLLFELLVIVPKRVPVDESPVFLLYQDWALGLIFLKIWTRLVMLDHILPLVDHSWRVKFERVREDGFSRLQGLWVLREIVFPIIMKLLTTLCVPYVLARGVFPMFGCPLVVYSAVHRFAWLGCLIFSELYIRAKRFHLWFTNLHNSIRDDRYLTYS